jgi:hypothetical protein
MRAGQLEPRLQSLASNFGAGIRACDLFGGFEIDARARLCEERGCEVD